MNERIDRILRTFDSLIQEEADEAAAEEEEGIDYGPFRDVDKVYTQSVERFLNRKLKSVDPSRVRLGMGDKGYFLVVSETAAQRICLFMAKAAILFEKRNGEGGWWPELSFQRTPRGPYVKVDSIE